MRAITLFRCPSARRPSKGAAASPTAGRQENELWGKPKQ